MRRGTSCGPYMVLVDKDISGYAAVVLTIRDQYGTEVDIAKSALSITASSITFSLTETQSLSLKSGDISLQIRAKNSDTDAVATPIMHTNMEDVLKDGALNVG